MDRLRLATVSAVVVAAAFAAPAQAVITVSSLSGAPDPGIPSGFTTVITFDAPAAPGIINTTIGNVVTAAGNISGQRAAPAGTPAGGVYQSIGTNGSSTFNFINYLPTNQVLTGFSLYWGSVDSHNAIDFINDVGTAVASFAGNQLPRFDGNQSLGTANPRVTFMIDGVDRIQKVRLRSAGNAFEYDNIAVDTGPLPEPASWALLVTGFGLTGAAMRRRAAAQAG
jgi:hypothetical protein